MTHRSVKTRHHIIISLEPKTAICGVTFTRYERNPDWRPACSQCYKTRYRK